MIDVLADRMVMVGDDSKQGLDDNQIYFTANLAGPTVAVHIQIGESLSEAPNGVTITVTDLLQALRHLGIRR